MMDMKKLFAEFPRASVHWRVQGQPYERNGTWSAMALAYIDARDVMDRLDEVCGPENWQNEFTETASGRVICRLGIWINDRWVWKSDGAGSTDVEGEKGGVSDALKRSAVCWGIGRYLYRLDAPWVRCEVNQKNGKTFWKRWSEDPWSKVRNAPQHVEPENESQDQGSPAHISEPQYLQLTAKIKEAGFSEKDIEYAEHVPELRHITHQLYETIMKKLDVDIQRKGKAA